jgi:serine/threonine protein kinase
MNVVGAELAVSVMLSSLVRRGVCPNFVATRGVFSCPFEPPSSYWGNAENRNPSGDFYKSPAMKKKLKEPFRRGRYQYIRMELCDQGDAEEFLKRQPDETLTPWRARQILFQISFALHAAADKFSLKHYDVKLLNIFLQRVPTVKNGEVVLRYGLGEHTFSLRSSREEAIVAKLADYGTANVDSGSNDQHVTIAQFTTLENTPPDYLILGDQARQGHGHDCFGLGLCMLHLFTGHAPYEEILEDVTCPPNFKNELRKIWENEEESQYSVIRSIILADVYKDEDGHIIEGEPDEVLYDTLYKFLVLFGVPKDHQNLNTKVMCAIKSTLTLEGRQNNKGRGGKKLRSDARKFSQDRRKYSLSHGSNSYVSRARESLMVRLIKYGLLTLLPGPDSFQLTVFSLYRFNLLPLKSMDGGMELLMSLVDFDPQKRSSALDVLNSSFMAPLRELPGHVSQYPEEDEVLSYTSFSTQKIC